MKTLAWIIIALLVGVILGHWTVRPELQKAQREIATLQEELKRRASRRDAMPDVSSLLRLPEPPAAPAPPKTLPAPEANQVISPPATEPGAAPTARSPQEELQRAIDLWKTRSDMARGIFQSRVNASPVQMQMFDQIIASMNERLAEKIKEWADYWQEASDNEAEIAEIGLRMVHDLSGVVVEAYDELDRQFPSDWRDKAGEEFQLFDFINPEVALPLMEARRKS
ncbi:MAG: hypothetical protein NZ483_09440 [Verrucomicrobiae bacterium]|nr:hypothetical protein [Verrucomicrobiae bacterium]MDW8343712.1 hypothetical protein [Verrucomicrobiae bacterium]